LFAFLPTFSLHPNLLYNLGILVGQRLPYLRLVQLQEHNSHTLAQKQLLRRLHLLVPKWLSILLELLLL
jgi:fatty acid desaturase